MLLAAGIILVILLLLWYKLSDTTLSALPGPPKTIVFGNALQIDRVRPFLTVDKLARKYGGIYGLRIFLSNVLVVSDYESIYEVLVKKSSDFDGRPVDFRVRYLSEENDVLLVQPGPAHKGRRKVMQKFLKQFGSGIAKIEEITTTASSNLITRLASTNATPVDIYDTFFESMTEVIAILLLGETISKQDSQTVMESILTGAKALGNTFDAHMLDLLPFLRHFGNQCFKLLQKSREIKENLIHKWISSKPDIGFIHHILSMPVDEQKMHHVFEYNAQTDTIFDFLGAGTATTSTTLTCLMNCLCYNPSIQKKLQDEVSVHIGSSRPPKMSDRDNMPYHKATLLEISRYASIVPFGIPHRTTKDTHVGPYAIPKGVDIWVNLWTMHHDEKFWDEPFQFRPERYLDDVGELVAPDHPVRKHTMPFGAGNRVCVGEIFAKSRMFLFLSRIMQEFTILPATSLEDQPSCDPRDMLSGILNTPPPFKVRFQQI